MLKRHQHSHAELRFLTIHYVDASIGGLFSPHPLLELKRVDMNYLLAGIARFPGDSPWGSYVGTWDLPRKISRKAATEMTQPRKERVAAWSEDRPCHNKQ